MSQENRGLWTVYCSSDFSRVAQFIFENVLRFQFELSSFPGLTEVKGHEGRAFTCSHSMSQYKPITIWEYWVAFAVNKIFWGINGKEKKFQRQYFHACTSSANKIGLLGKQNKSVTKICNYVNGQPGLYIPAKLSASSAQKDLDRIEKNELSFIFTCFFFECLC